MTFDDLKDEGELTYKDLIDCIEHELKDIDKNITKEEVFDRYEKHQIESCKRIKALKEDSNNAEIISIFSIALDFILTVSIKRFYYYISIDLFRHNILSLGDIDNEHWSELIDIIKLILKMSKDNGEIVSLDQCMFINKDKLN